jgi:hypothetical protein
VHPSAIPSGSHHAFGAPLPTMRDASELRGVVEEPRGVVEGLRDVGRR